MPIEGRRLSKKYGDVRAIDEVDVTIPDGKITALVGENGAGKTTLLSLLAGVIAPTSGSIERSGSIAYIDQDPALDPEMTGHETLRLMAALYGVPAEERFGLGEILGRRVGTWSGGQKRRLHIACALLHSPALIFLDEPTAGLDAEGARLLYAELDAHARRGATVVVVGHDLAEIEREAAHVIVLHRGKILAAGSPKELVEKHARNWLRVRFSDGRREWIEGDTLPPLDGVEEVAVHRKDLASAHRTLIR